MSTKPKAKRKRTYIIPVVVTGQFGVDAEIRATSRKEAEALAKKGDLGDSCDGYDWNRWVEIKYEIGDWKP